MKMTKSKLTPTHAAAIAGLGAVLYFVFPSGPKTEPVADAPASSPDAAATSSTVTQPSSTATATKAESLPVAAAPKDEELLAVNRPLPTVGEDLLASIVADDLFASLAAIDDVKVEDGERVVATEVPAEPVVPPLVTRAAGSKISVLYSSSRGSKFAVVDGAVVKPGDVTESGLQIEGISNHGVEVRAAAEVALP